MKILYYDCFCGISGDMNMAALLDVGVDETYLRQELAKLALNSEFELQVTRAAKQGITGTRVEVILAREQELQQKAAEDEPHEHDHHHHEHEHHENHEHEHHDHEHHDHHHDDHHHGHDHSHAHDAHNHAHGTHSHTHDGGESHVHRNLKDIETIIQNSALSDSVKETGLAIFQKVAEAEAKIHGKGLYEVHFHEVGAIDSIVDIMGAAICLDYLKVDKIMASSVQLGGGFVKCAHGIMPVPAPATAEIVKSIPVKTGIVPFETTTPTGAAILAATADTFTDKLDFIIEKTGYGIGHKDFEIPNVLRVYLGEAK